MQNQELIRERGLTDFLEGYATALYKILIHLHDFSARSLAAGHILESTLDWVVGSLDNLPSECREEARYIVRSSDIPFELINEENSKKKSQRLVLPGTLSYFTGAKNRNPRSFG